MNFHTYIAVMFLHTYESRGEVEGFFFTFKLWSVFSENSVVASGGRSIRGAALLNLAREECYFRHSYPGQLTFYHIL